MNPKIAIATLLAVAAATSVFGQPSVNERQTGIRRPTEDDVERMAKAQAKRDRRAAKRARQ